MRRALLAVSFVVLLLGLGVGRAEAHAELESTSPAANAVVATAPGNVTLDFSETVDVGPGSVRVFDTSGKRVDSGRPPAHPAGDRTKVVLPLPPLGDGTYAVTWRVTSADSHPVHGAFTFTVGDAPPAASTSAAPPASGGSRTVGVLYAVVRTLAFLSLLVLVGGTAFLLFLWPAGWSYRRARRVLYAVLLVAFVSTALGIGLQAVYGPGLPLADMFKPSVLRPVLHTRFGRVWLLRLVLLVAFDVVLNLAERARRLGPALVALATVVGLALLAPPGLSGHAATGDLVPLALPVDLVHLAAAAVWLGGLAMLTACVLPGRVDGADSVVGRFSKVALWCVVVIVATGSFQSWRQVRSWDAVTHTTYGRTLLVKVAVFVGLVALAAVSRRLVRRARPARVGLGQTVLGEVVLAVAVVAATSMLVNAVPARQAVALPISKELSAGKLLVDITVDPAKAGPSAVHLYTLNQQGQVAEIVEAQATLSLPSKGIDRLAVPLRRAGPGHFAAYGFVIPVKGQWRLEVSVRTSDIDVFRTGTSIRIR